MEKKQNTEKLKQKKIIIWTNINRFHRALLLSFQICMSVFLCRKQGYFEECWGPNQHVCVSSQITGLEQQLSH